MTRESVLAVVNMFNPAGVSSTVACVSLNEAKPQNDRMPPRSLLFQTWLANSLITDEYLRNARTPEEIRDRFTDVIGDMLMTLPVLSVAGYLSGPEMWRLVSWSERCSVKGSLIGQSSSWAGDAALAQQNPVQFPLTHMSSVTGVFSDAGVPVYLYEFVYRPDIHRHSRPSFVKADHADDVAFMFGSCFWDGHAKLMGRGQRLRQTFHLDQWDARKLAYRGRRGEAALMFHNRSTTGLGIWAWTHWA